MKNFSLKSELLNSVYLVSFLFFITVAFGQKGGIGSLTVTVPECAKGAAFTIKYKPENGKEVTETFTAPYLITVKKGTSYSITGIQPSINGNSYTGQMTVQGTTPDNNDFSATVFLPYVDDTLPTISAPASLTVNAESGKCTASGVNLGMPATADNCSVASVKNNAVEPFQLGDTTVTWTVTDSSGNTQTATQTITVKDDQMPTITAPMSITVNADSGKCTASGVDLGTAVTADNCSVASVSNNAPESFPLGDTTITWTVTDGSGNIQTATQTVTVIDDQLPIISAPQTVIINADSGKCTASGVDLGIPMTADNCSVASVNNNAPQLFPLGDTIVIWTITDGSGNKAFASQVVTVNDVEQPVFTSCPTNITLAAAQSTATWIAPTATDCSDVVVTQTAGPASGAAFEAGTTTAISYEATDAAGNKSSCSFTVTRESEVLNPILPGDGSGPKVQICHRTGSDKNPTVNISVDESAVPAHLAHGDVLGDCNTTFDSDSTSRKAVEISPLALELNVYPNPTDNEFTLRLNGNTKEQVEVLVYDVLGRLMEKINEFDDGQPISFGADLQKAAYFAVVRLGANSRTIKLLKK